MILISLFVVGVTAFSLEIIEPEVDEPIIFENG